MKILLLHQYFLENDDPGGSRWNEMTRMWMEQGHEVEVLAGMVHANGSSKRAEYKGKYFFKRKQGEVNVIRCHVSESYNLNFLGRLWGYFSFVFSSLFAGLFKTTLQPDVVIVTSPPLFLGISGYLISRIRRIPFVFEVRDLWPESAIDTGVVKSALIIKLAYWLEDLMYKKAALINVLTPAFRDVLVSKKGVPADKVILIPNAADFGLSDGLLANFDALTFRERLDLTGKFVITYVGAHGVANALDQILETAALLTDKPVLFLLIGQGMEKTRLMDRAREMGLQNVRFLDPVPKSEVFKYILASDMGTSVLKRVDTFKTIYSNKTFDYMACKKPILMAIDGVSRRLLEDANAGTFVEPENPAHFKEVILSYLDNPEILSEQGISGYDYAKKNFERNELAAKYLERVEAIVNKSK